MQFTIKRFRTSIVENNKTPARRSASELSECEIETKIIYFLERVFIVRREKLEMQLCRRRKSHSNRRQSQSMIARKMMKLVAPETD